MKARHIFYLLAVTVLAVTSCAKDYDDEELTYDKFATTAITAVTGEASGLTLAPGSTLQLQASSIEADEVVSWTSSDPAIATVDNNGLVTAVSEGQTTITVTTRRGATATYVVNVSSGSVDVHDDPIDQGQAQAPRRR